MMPFDTMTIPLIKGCHDMQSTHKVPQPTFQVLDAMPNRPMPVGPITNEDRRFVDFLIFLNTITERVIPGSA